MEVEESVAERQDVVVDESRDLLGDGAARIARKGAVEVQPVDRRGALAGHGGVDVVGRHQDEASLDLARVEVADQLADGDRPLIFVAVIAALDDDGRPLAVGDHRNRHAGDAPGVVVGRVRDHDEADLSAGLVEIDGGEGGGRAGCGGVVGH